MENAYSLYLRGAGNYHLEIEDRDHSFDASKLSSIKFTSGLINGRGRFGDNMAPLSVFHVTPGGAFRLHPSRAPPEK